MTKNWTQIDSNLEFNLLSNLFGHFLTFSLLEQLKTREISTESWWEFLGNSKTIIG